MIDKGSLRSTHPRPLPRGERGLQSEANTHHLSFITYDMFPEDKLNSNRILTQFSAFSKKTKRFRRSLQAQLVSLLLIVSLVPLLWLSYFAYDNGKNRLEESIGVSLSRIAAEKVSKADRIIGRYIAQIKAQIPIVKSIVLSASEKSSSELKARWEGASPHREDKSGAASEAVDGATAKVERLAAAAGEYGQVIITNSEGIIIGASDPNLNAEQAKEMKSETLDINTDGIYKLLYGPIVPYSETVRINGRQLSRDVDYTIDYPQKQINIPQGSLPSPLTGGVNQGLSTLQAEYQIYTLWYRMAYNNGLGRLFIGDVIYNQEKQLHYITTAVPIRRADEVDSEVIGILKMDFALPELMEIVDPESNKKIAEEIAVLIIDGYGKCVAAPPLSDIKMGDDKILNTEAAMRAIQESYGYTTEKGEGGIKRVYGFAHTSNWRYENSDVMSDYRDAKGIRNFADWAVIVSQPTKMAFRSAVKLRNNILFFTLISCLVVIPIAVIFAKRIVTPIMQVANAAKAIGRGEFDQEIEATTRNEVGILVEEFNTMRRNLKLAEEHLRQEAEKMTAVVNSIAEGLIVLDKNNCILHINPTAERLLGIDTKLRGLEIGTAIKDHEMHAAIEKSQARVDRYETHSFEVVLNKSEQQIILKMLASPFLDDDGQLLGTVYVLEDITEAKKTERMKSDFVNLVSHEFRTPLTSIRGFVQLILDGKVGSISPVQERSLIRVLRQARRLEALINDLLDVSRIESGRIEMKQEVVSLVDVAIQRIEELKPQADEKKITVELIEPDSLPNVMGDSERIGQVFTNLIGNAIKFTPDGGNVTVKLRPEGTYILAQVIDTGPGIPIDKQEKIFDKFYQLSEVQTRQQGGSGLGLSIVKSIVESHGGRVWVKSQEGKGSDFRFILPIAGVTTISKS
ncbi:HAMP domain-containing protein [Candidatus Poribacteria bacterium]|nr:HAMP domain-containing protein [Candidatus Poribacteria bacterium]